MKLNIVVLFLILVSLISTQASATVMINEFMANPSTGPEWIELYNDGASNVDISNWQLDDILNGGSNAYTIPQGTTIASGGYLVFNGTVTGINLNNGGDNVTLLDASNNLVDVRVYSTSTQGVSEGRKHDGFSIWTTFTSPTPGASNNVAPTFTTLIPDVTKDEDFVGFTHIADLNTLASDSDGDSLKFSVSGKNASEVDCKVVGTNLLLASFANWNGVASCTIEVDDGFSGKATDTFTITVNSVNDAPEYSKIPDQIWDEGTSIEVNLNDYFTDVDGDTLTFNTTIPDDIKVEINQLTGIVTLIPEDDDFVGSDDIKFTATDGVETTESNKVNLFVRPTICKKGKVGDLKIKIEEPNDKSDFEIGDKITIEVNIENEGEDDLDIVVKAMLYDLNTGELIDSIKTKKFNLDENEDEDLTLELEIKNDEDLDEDHTYMLYVKIYEDEDENCNFESVEIDIERPDSEVIITKFIASTTAECNSLVNFEVEVESIGEDDQEDVYIQLLNDELGVLKTSDKFNLGDYNDKDNDAVKIFDITLPENVKPQEYTFFAKVIFDDGREKNVATRDITITCVTYKEQVIEEVKEEVIEEVKEEGESRITGAATLVKSLFGGGSFKTIFLVALDIILLLVIVYFLVLVFRGDNEDKF